MSVVVKSNEELLLSSQNNEAKLDTLNTNVAKESKQDTMITTLSNIETNTNGLGLGTTGTQTTVARSATSVTLLSSLSTRNEFYIRNDSTTDLWVSYGATATVNKGIKLAKGDTLVGDKYTGQVSGIWTSAGAGNAEIISVD